MMSDDERRLAVRTPSLPALAGKQDAAIHVPLIAAKMEQQREQLQAAGRNG
jgi:hypothetical protein